MRPHLLCFYKSIAVTSLATIDAVADGRFTLRDSNTKFAVNDDWNCFLATVGGPDVATLDRDVVHDRAQGAGRACI